MIKNFKSDYWICSNQYAVAGFAGIVSIKIKTGSEINLTRFQNRLYSPSSSRSEDIT